MFSNIKRNMALILFGLSIILSIAAIISYRIILPITPKTYSTHMIASTILTVCASLVLIFYTMINKNHSKYLFLLSIIILTISNILWMGSLVSIILYLIISISMFITINPKNINYIIIIDCITKPLIIVAHIFLTARRFGDFNFVVPATFGGLVALCVNSEIWLFKFTPNINNQLIPTITCPYCKSANVKRLGTAGRLLSVGIFGLASGKIGKQWHCNSCGSDF